MSASHENYRIFAIKYAHHHRLTRDNFLGGDPHDGPMPIDYFVWAIVGAARTIRLQHALSLGRFIRPYYSRT
ncbi:metallo-beta-lactamase family protein [Yersinia wautersii]|uniref:Metallo-beta-lactamase family protein n=2 Tax=Yersinia pseudotuberculosis complex TaxID=1649845 RepID=A0A380Q3Q1_YERPU|nr:metallo-beta-lactamase family protein [Yersinia wautersii]SUP80423.1 metallo-beta-lactamase family protein [Yersinia pseudotuberculosis]